MSGQEQRSEPSAPDDTKARKVNLPLRLTPAQHDALRQVAFDRRVSLHSLMLEGVAAVLQRHGK